MAEPLTINVQQAAKAAPAVYTVAGTTEVEPLSAFATFDGTTAASAFLTALTFYSASGLILARVFPETQVAAGGSADVTFAPFLGLGATSQVGLLTRITLVAFSLPDNTTTDLTYTAFDVNSCGVTTADFITFVVPAIGANAVYGIHWYARMPDPFPVIPASWDFHVEGPWGTDVTINGITGTDRLVRGSPLNDSAWGVEANGIQQAPFTFNTRAYQDSGAAVFMNGCMDIIYLGQWV